MQSVQLPVYHAQQGGDETAAVRTLVDRVDDDKDLQKPPQGDGEGAKEQLKL